MIYLQNKVTGEIHEVVDGSQEYREMIAERTADNKPVFEQQSDAAIAAKVERAEAGELRDMDLPKNSPVVPVRNKVGGFAAEREPWKNLTEAEKELGLTREKKAEQAIADETAQSANARTKSRAADTILNSDTSRRGGQGVVTDLPTDADETPQETDEEAKEREATEQAEREAEEAAKTGDNGGGGE